MFEPSGSRDPSPLDIGDSKRGRRSARSCGTHSPSVRLPASLGLIRAVSGPQCDDNIGTATVPTNDRTADAPTFLANSLAERATTRKNAAWPGGCGSPSAFGSLSVPGGSGG